jgi:PAS domain-containing protein
MKLQVIASETDKSAFLQRLSGERAAQHYAAIVESSTDAILSKDLNGIITSWNRGAQLLFGYTAEEAVGQPVTLLIPVDRQDEEPFILGRIRQGESVDHYEIDPADKGWPSHRYFSDRVANQKRKRRNHRRFENCTRYFRKQTGAGAAEVAPARDGPSRQKPFLSCDQRFEFKRPLREDGPRGC